MRASAHDPLPRPQRRSRAAVDLGLAPGLRVEFADPPPRRRRRSRGCVLPRRVIEDRRGGFERGGWTAAHADARHGRSGSGTGHITPGCCLHQCGLRVERVALLFNDSGSHSPSASRQCLNGTSQLTHVHLSSAYVPPFGLALSTSSHRSVAGRLFGERLRSMVTGYRRGSRSHPSHATP
jgi:hypothetical protein